MRSPIRALLVALVTTLSVMLVLPSVAQAKPRHVHSSKTSHTSKTTTKRVVKHPWKKGHAKAHAKPHRARKSSGAKHPWKKKG
jgi:hypothetical protein